LGGGGTESVAGIGVDSGSAIYVAGTTTSADFPTLNGFQTAPRGSASLGHVFVAQLKANGSALAYSTYLSGTAADSASGLALGGTPGRAYVTGTTQSANFPVTAGVVQATKPAGTVSQFFASKLDTTRSGASSLVYSTYLGGSQPANAQTVGGGIGVDPSGNAYITGGTSYSNFPVVNAIQPVLKGGVDAFVTKLNPTATARQFSTYFGGTGDDFANATAIDAAGNTYFTGSTTSTDYPVRVPFQATLAGGTDAFATKLSVTGTLIYSTYIGGSGNDAG